MEKVSFPIKTKIAAWWITIMGGMGASIVIAERISMRSELHYTLGAHGPMLSFLFNLFIFYYLFFFFLPGFFLFMRKKWAWWFSVSMLSISLLYFLPYFMLISVLTIPFAFLISPIIIIPLIIIPLILLLLDRKNFWKIAP